MRAVACLPASARGRSTRFTSLVATAPTCMDPSSGSTWAAMVERQSRSDFEVVPRRQVSAFSAIARGSASANEIVRARRGSPPVRATARLSAAIRRASARLTSSALPRPMSMRRPCTISL